MEHTYLIFVVLLFILAITDLIVGVSNDAVNFLNSSIGSKVAKRQTILIIAGLGIFCGAFFSSGMMEIARKGIFIPERFFFDEVMIIFLAVMLTDIILLDLFNTFGMPTSTTVSIVFELLGASVVIAMIKVSNASEDWIQISEYINSGRALAIISGIFLSVLVAFSIGAIVQFLSRSMFSFRYNRANSMLTAAYSGICLTALTYFLVFKGLKGASFVSEEVLKYIELNMPLLVGLTLVLFTGLSRAFEYWKINQFKVIVLFGTFSLAMAFAGNDLVNFIGVPIAGFESFLVWRSSGVSANEFSMQALSEPVQTQTYLLLIAGVVMVVTLWFSRKAQTVTDTEVNLGRQDDGDERFRPNDLSRIIVEASLRIGRIFDWIIPQSYKSFLTRQFNQSTLSAIDADDKPAFDLIRASMNLALASLLISIATSYKLPLSTTYVSFMVAMGTSLADRAWGRESAVYRVSGVLNVIGGWFLTAFIAFMVAAIFAVVMHYSGVIGTIFAVVLAGIALLRSFVLHRKRSSRSVANQVNFAQESHLIAATCPVVTLHLELLRNGIDATLEALMFEDESALKAAKRSLSEVQNNHQGLLRAGYKQIQKEGVEFKQSRTFFSLAAHVQDSVQSFNLIQEAIEVHLKNKHRPINTQQKSSMTELKRDLIELLMASEHHLQAEENRVDLLMEKLQNRIDGMFRYQFELMTDHQTSRKSLQLMFTILQELEDIQSSVKGILNSYHTKPDSAPEVMTSV